jgi:hypothetical protein
MTNLASLRANLSENGFDLLSPSALLQVRGGGSKSKRSNKSKKSRKSNKSNKSKKSRRGGHGNHYGHRYC